MSPGTYTATVRVVTDDPLGVDVAETTHKLTWDVHADETVSYNWRSVGCWAANPSPFGTHWFVDSCSFIAEGTSHNWDFGDDTKATYADHWSKIQGKNDGWYYYWWDAMHSGEFLLDGDMYAS